MSPEVQRLIAEIRALCPEDRQEVLAVLSEAPPFHLDRPLTEEEAADLAYQKHLLAAGLIREIRLRRRDQQVFEQYTPAKIIGPPLSQTIIEERR